MCRLRDVTIFLLYLEIIFICGSPVVKRSASHPGDRIVRYGDELFIAHTGEDNNNKNGDKGDDKTKESYRHHTRLDKREVDELRIVDDSHWPSFPSEDIVKRSVDELDMHSRGLVESEHSETKRAVDSSPLSRQTRDTDQLVITSSSTYPDKKVVKFGDQLFLVDKNTPGTNENQGHQITKRSSTDTHDDIVNQLNHVDGSPHHKVHKRSAINDEAYRWKHKTVPFTFDSSFHQEGRKLVEAAMDEWAQHTCVRFRPATRSDVNKVKFVQGDGCYSFVGMVDEGTQDISLDAEGCRYVSTALHEIGHALGMYHTQVRPDRDQYIKVDLSDVKKNLQDNFIKQTWKTSHHYGVDYDFKSIMHYDGTSFTSSGGTSIKTLDPKWQKIIGNAKHLSFGDIEMMNKMYHCKPASCSLKDSDCAGTSFVGMNCKCMCPGPSDVDPVVLCSAKSSQVIESKDIKQTDKNSNVIPGSGSGSGNQESGSDEWGHGGDDGSWDEWGDGGGADEWEPEDSGDSEWEYYR